MLIQNQIHNNQLRRAEQESRSLQERVQKLTTQNKDLNVQLQEIKRRQAEIECKVQTAAALHTLHLRGKPLQRYCGLNLWS